MNFSLAFPLIFLVVSKCCCKSLERFNLLKIRA
nr:MAG TPA: hypothetical protein [Caudoviricetes sp.]DAX47401.1 MAG TPA: hypothetical protein [Caudoviricetes sp.]